MQYNEANAVPFDYISVHPISSEAYTEDVKKLQKRLKLNVDGKCGPVTLSRARQEYMEKMPPKEVSKIEIMKIISKFEGDFWSCNRDGEYRGLFDRGDRKHWASGKVHIGLSFGFIQFTQDGGALGKLLKLMIKKDRELFLDVFGEHSEELVSVTNKIKGVRISGRSRRVQKVGGYDLWEDYWVSRFKRAGMIESFQECQLELASDDYLDPAIKHCNKLNFKSELALLVMLDRCIQHGPGRAPKLFPEGQDEFERIYKMYNKYRSQRWAHRTLKLWRNPDLSSRKFQLRYS